ncbi:MAG: flp pilus-assembly TadE/G-like family protein [Actinobacteria bacterium]|nr:flp pilus-assembly TadE/G-like family protein [Actinomycetota bacterium]
MRADRGSGTVLGIVMVTLLLFGGSACWALVSVSTARQRAAIAADLVALATARAGCPWGGVIARANHVSLDACEFVGDDAVVHVSVHPAGTLGPWSLPTVSASSRAGPA